MPGAPKCKGAKCERRPFRNKRPPSGALYNSHIQAARFPQSPSCPIAGGPKYCYILTFAQPTPPGGNAYCWPRHAQKGKNMSGTRLSDVIVKLPDRSVCRVERRLVINRSDDASPSTRYICSLPTGEAVTWLSGGKYRMPDGSVAVAVAHKPPHNAKDNKSGSF